MDRPIFECRFFGEAVYSFQVTRSWITVRLLEILLAGLAVGLTGCERSAHGNAQLEGLSAKAQPPAMILIIRHAEKPPPGDAGLAPEGYTRAQLLLKVFLPPGVRPDLPTPQYIFAAASTSHSNRSALTVSPLADALHLEINQSFKDHSYADLAAELLSGKYAGKVVLVSWHHGKIPELAAALGATPPYNPWPEGQFDRIWKITYVDGKATLQDLPYELSSDAGK
jgi:hypothetical protein